MNNFHNYNLHMLIYIDKLQNTQVRAFLQLGRNAGKPSISVAVDVATDLMVKKGITPKFTLDDLRDNITHYNCGARGQSRKFHQLDRNLEWLGSTVALKVPVIHLHAFPKDVQLTLAKSKYHILIEGCCACPALYLLKHILVTEWYTQMPA